VPLMEAFVDREAHCVARRDVGGFHRRSSPDTHRRSNSTEHCLKRSPSRS
jgi:hypothetical protein